ncbi:hypothetical protein AB0N09_33315 [Streptomyces erythrochromogenes]|uniref:hypothetical protein n=1 Tax=Streptomyces erythrochromogenes TaxID=285574 RepID=UPI0034123B7E
MSESLLNAHRTRRTRRTRRTHRTVPRPDVSAPVLLNLIWQLHLTGTDPGAAARACGAAFEPAFLAVPRVPDLAEEPDPPSRCGHFARTGNVPRIVPAGSVMEAP